MMDVKLRCPNCYREIGECSKDSGYEKKYYYKNDKDEEICPSCGDYSPLYPFWVVLTFFGVVIGFTLIIKFIL